MAFFHFDFFLSVVDLQDSTTRIDRTARITPAPREPTPALQARQPALPALWVGSAPRCSEPLRAAATAASQCDLEQHGVSQVLNRVTHDCSVWRFSTESLRLLIESLILIFIL